MMDADAYNEGSVHIQTHEGEGRERKGCMDSNERRTVIEHT